MNAAKIAVPLGVALAMSVPMQAAQAQEGAGPWGLQVGVAHVGFSASADVQVAGTLVPGGSASASPNTTLGFEVSYRNTPSLTTRFLAGVPPTTTLTGAGALATAGKLGKATYAPAVLSLTWSPFDSGPVRPYVGAGVNYTIVMNQSDAFISNLKVKSAFGSVLEVGAEMPLSNGWFIGLDARKIFLKTQADGVLPAFGGAAAHAEVRLDPLVVLAAVGRRF